MTEEQEKYIIEKYSFFWNGVYMPNNFNWIPTSLQDNYLFFAKYINNYKQFSNIKEKENIPQLIKNKSYTNFRKYIGILSLFCSKFAYKRHYKSHIRSFENMLYFTKSKTAFDESFEKYASFYFTMFLSSSTRVKVSNAEKNVNITIDDAMLVYEIVRPDIIYNARLTKDMVLLKDNFNRINQILLKYNKYVYYTKSGIYSFINPTKIKQFKYLVELLIKNGYVRKKRSYSNVFVNEDVISKTMFFILCFSFMKELHFFNYEIFCKQACAFFHIQRTSYKKEKCPYKLQLIFDEVRKYDNEIINQQKTNK